MRVVVRDCLGGQQWVGYDGEAGFVIGKDVSCDISLNSGFVSPRHAQVERGPGGWELRVLPGANSINLNGQSLAAGGAVPLDDRCEVTLAQFVLLFEPRAVEVKAKDPGVEEVNELQQQLHANVLRRLDLRRMRSAGLKPTPDVVEQISSLIDDLLEHDFEQRIFKNTLTRRRLLTMAFEIRLAALLSADTDDDDASASDDEDRRNIEADCANPANEQIANEYVQRMAKRLQIEASADSLGTDLVRIDTGTADLVAAMIDEMLDHVENYIITQFLKKLLFDTIFGLGPLQDLLDMPNVTEIMVVHPSLVYIERSGQLVRSNRTFVSNDALRSIIERIVSPLGRRIDRSQPLVDARLKDGSRVNAIVEPLAVKGPCLTIRRFPAKPVVADDLIRWGAITPGGLALLRAWVRNRTNIIVAGGTGSGKTTLLNVLSALIPEHERIVTIEDSAELQLQQEHVVTLETRPATAEGAGEYTIRDLVKNALRMRPDRIIVGECRGAETIDMLQAMNTGHAGSMTTVHANSAEDVTARLETMILMGVEMPLTAIRRLVSQSIDVIAFVKRFPTGRRMVTQITEVVGLHPVTGEIEMRDIMRDGGTAAEPKLVPTGYLPSSLELLVQRGHLDLGDWFGGEAEA